MVIPMPRANDWPLDIEWALIGSGQRNFYASSGDGIEIKGSVIGMANDIEKIGNRQEYHYLLLEVELCQCDQLNQLLFRAPLFPYTTPLPY
ncbi:hypothetical protein N9Y89_01605 [bacterium]|nr:hypothetical protein [bacterium]